jgi:acetylornithine/succinyldiaminopimelate/putrescine aminotransferase
MDRPRIVRAANDLLYAADGRCYIDLFSAHGATWQGHSHPGISAEIAAQLNDVWVIGGLDSAVCAEAQAQIETFFPSSHAVAALYSTGMEAAEFALRFARAVTGRNGVAGFANSMHGKSLATAYLGWDNRDGMQLPAFHRLPFLQDHPEGDVLARLETLLRGHDVGAVMVEPLQGSGGGRMASAAFHATAARLCREQGALLVFDEILTGFHRTGAAFRFQSLGITPDVVLIGKALGNGFPVSAVVADRRYAVRPAMLPGSTFAGNPLACAAVRATLRHMRALDLESRVAAIEDVVTRHLGWLAQTPVALRGLGAMWVIELPAEMEMEPLVAGIYGAGVCVGFAGHQFRLLPAATIEPRHLERACTVVAEHLARVMPEGEPLRTPVRGGTDG